VIRKIRHVPLITLEESEVSFYAQIGELENLKHRKQSLQHESKAAQQRVQVGKIPVDPSRMTDTRITARRT
jgi:hypothetical protein